jgi:hypothetical protein
MQTSCLLPYQQAGRIQYTSIFLNSVQSGTRQDAFIFMNGKNDFAK